MDDFSQHKSTISLVDTISSRNHEITSLRNSLKKLKQELRSATKMKDVAVSELKILEDNYADLKDSIDSKSVIANKNHRLEEKMRLTNRMLLKTLNSLELKSDVVDGFVTAESSKRVDGEIILSQNNDTYLQNLKLKESLLNITRDHFRNVDGIMRMNTGVVDLRLALRQAEKKNRHLLKELAELRNEDVRDLMKSTAAAEAAADQIASIEKDFGPLDEKMQVS